MRIEAVELSRQLGTSTLCSSAAAFIYWVSNHWFSLLTQLYPGSPPRQIPFYFSGDSLHPISPISCILALHLDRSLFTSLKILFIPSLQSVVSWLSTPRQIPLYFSEDSLHPISSISCILALYLGSSSLLLETRTYGLNLKSRNNGLSLSLKSRNYGSNYPSNLETMVQGYPWNLETMVRTNPRNLETMVRAYPWNLESKVRTYP